MLLLAQNSLPDRHRIWAYATSLALLRPPTSSYIAPKPQVRSGCLAVEGLSCKRLGCGAGLPRCPFLSAGCLQLSRVAKVRQ